MERSSNGKTRSSPSRRQQHYEEIWRPGPNQGAIMESLDPSLVGTNIEHEVASAVNIPSMYKNKSNRDVKNSNKQIDRSNMSSSTTSFGSSGKCLLWVPDSIRINELFQIILKMIRLILTSRARSKKLERNATRIPFH